MTYLQSIILGIVEGITEFLPISSTGHLILASEILHVANSDFVKSFEIIIQLGAIMAVLFLYWKSIFKDFELLKKVFVAFLPTAVIGLALYKILKAYLLGNTMVVVAMLFIGGVIILWFSKWEYRKEKTEAVSPKENNSGPSSDFSLLTYKQSFFIGLFQSIAIIPGVSRSAATIIGGRLLGIGKIEIVEFSFLLAIPTMTAASALDILKNYHTILNGNFGILSVGFLVSFAVALLAIKFFLNYIKKNSFAVFGWYRIILGLFAYFLIF